MKKHKGKILTMVELPKKLELLQNDIVRKKINSASEAFHKRVTKIIELELSKK